MQPDIVVFSDKSNMYETQDTDALYRPRLNGINDYGEPILGGFKKRRILTTRRDGTLHVDVCPAGGYLITPSKRTPRLLPPLPLRRLVA